MLLMLLMLLMLIVLLMLLMLLMALIPLMLLMALVAPHAPHAPQAADVVVGSTRNTKRTQHESVHGASLGLFEASLAVITNVRHVKESYDDFLEQISGAYRRGMLYMPCPLAHDDHDRRRRAGRNLGWEDVAQAAAASNVNIKGQFEAAGVAWGYKVVTKKPAEFRVEMGRVTNTIPPPQCVDADEFERAVLKKKTLLDQMERQVDHDDEDGFVDLAPDKDSQWMTPEIKQVLEHAERDRAHLARVAKVQNALHTKGPKIEATTVMVAAAAGDIMSIREDILHPTL